MRSLQEVKADALLKSGVKAEYESMAEEFSYLPPWKNAMKTLFGAGGYTYGDLVPHDVLQDAMGLPKPRGKVQVEDYEAWRLRLVSQTEALADALLEDRNMCLQSVVGQGYKIIEPARQTDFAVKQGQKGLRSALSKMGRRLSFVDRSALTADQAKQNADALARMSFLQTQVGRRKLIG